MVERKERRGFASMSAEKQREIASKGGKAAHSEDPKTNGEPKKPVHEWTSEEARNAGRKGGQVSRGGKGRLIISPISPGGKGSPIAPTEPDSQRVSSDFHMGDLGDEIDDD